MASKLLLFASLALLFIAIYLAFRQAARNPPRSTRRRVADKDSSRFGKERHNERIFGKHA